MRENSAIIEIEPTVEFNKETHCKECEFTLTVGNFCLEDIITNDRYHLGCGKVAEAVTPALKIRLKPKSWPR